MKILISGASIAGPALAFWLNRFGIGCTVVERAPALRDGGYAVDLRGPALPVLEAMGLREKVRALETDTLSNAVVDAEGRIFGRMERGFGVIDAGDVEIHRADLAQLLFDETKARTEYRFGTTITSIEGREVTFSDGRTERYDLIVGADEVHSQVRALCFGPESGFVRSMGCELATFSAPNVLGLKREQLLFSGINRIASIKSAVNDTQLKLVLFSALPVDDGGDRRERIKRVFTEAGWRFPELLASMETADDFYADLCCQVRMEALFRGRVALVGDSGTCASPLAGQGSSLALVSAYVLAVALKNHESIDEALKVWNATILPWATKNQDLGLEIAKGFMPKTKFARWGRELAMRALPSLPFAGWIMEKSMGGIREASNAIELPSPSGRGSGRGYERDAVVRLTESN